ncbi:MAG TPA: response regulator [Gammaproteobacteria bacterium]|nr:response regulator [Gammaproteobacteria bacterium]
MQNPQKEDLPTSEDLVNFNHAAHVQTEYIITNLELWRTDPTQLHLLQLASKSVQTLANFAVQLKLIVINNLLKSIEKLLTALLQNTVAHEPVYKYIRMALNELEHLLEGVKKQEPLQENPELLAFYHQILEKIPQEDAPKIQAIEIIEPAVPIEIFHEEFMEILQELEQQIQHYAQDKTLDVVSDFKRLLHTLKGSSRLVGFSHLGKFVHAIEDLVEEKDVEESRALIQDTIRLLKQQEQKILEKINFNIDVEDLHQMQPLATNLPSPGVSTSSGGELEEKIRIPLHTLERLSQFAASTNIARAHIEQQQQLIKFYLNRIEDTLRHLRETSRALQLQSDLISLPSSSTTTREDFDPLELDRYTSLQQEAREIQGDVGNLFALYDNLSETLHSLNERVREQRHSVQALEENLTHMRMITFESIVPRLEKIVESISKELKKDVRLKIVQLEGEMDRTILQKLISPFEHMLRNAIDHGIESLEIRKALNKPLQGTIELTLIRKGPHVILQFKDDGRGIDLDAVKKRALAEGWWKNTVEPSERDLLKLIFLPGFSTSKTLTTISGRGIGMDIVNHEIRKIGGSLRIDTKKNEGTLFTIQLPFTLSINQALIFKGGFQLYGLLLSNLAGITRSSIEELFNLYTNKLSFHYMGKIFNLKYIGDFTGQGRLDPVNFLQKSLPVLLVEAQNQRLAIIIDSVVGPREVLVKSLGPQMQTVDEYLGASVLGDGKIVLMLDPFALVGSQVESVMSTEKTLYKSKLPMILVVDDSVTVRKVTTHLLERNQYQALSAKDGLDALEVLQNHNPDCILLDLEMPRMDGFAFLENIQKKGGKNWPIIVISSRSTEKYKKRVFALDADEFLSKPFQNDHLLATIHRLVKKYKQKNG